MDRWSYFPNTYGNFESRHHRPPYQRRPIENRARSIPPPRRSPESSDQVLDQLKKINKKLEILEDNQRKQQKDQKRWITSLTEDIRSEFKDVRRTIRHAQPVVRFKESEKPRAARRPEVVRFKESEEPRAARRPEDDKSLKKKRSSDDEKSLKRSCDERRAVKKRSQNNWKRPTADDDDSSCASDGKCTEDDPKPIIKSKGKDLQNMLEQRSEEEKSDGEASVTSSKDTSDEDTDD